MTVTGFQSQITYFQRLIREGTLAHAYLFSGPDMIGKKKSALEIYGHANPAGVSQADLLRIAPRVSEGEAKIYIDDVREIASFLSRKPLVGPYKFVVIDDAHQLTPEASNGLLKVLEEPSPYSVLILVSSQPKLLLQTITSRCQEVQFLPHGPDVIRDVVRTKKVGPEDGELIEYIAGGRLGWAISLIESEGVDDLRRTIGDFKKLCAQGITERLQYAKKIHEQDAYTPAVEYWLRWGHAQMMSGAIAPSVVRGLLQLRYMISQPQYNHRSALENFLIHL